MKSFSTWAERVGVILLAGMTFASIANAQQFTAGQKAKVKGQIVSRSGDNLSLHLGFLASCELLCVCYGCECHPGKQDNAESLRPGTE